MYANGLQNSRSSAITKRKIPTNRINLTVPRLVRERWGALVDKDYGMHGGSKVCGTAIVSLFMALPQDLRNALFEWGQAAERDPTVASDHAALLAGFADRLNAIIQSRAKNRAEGIHEDTPEEQRAMEHFIDRICAPELLSKAAGKHQRHAG